MDKGELYRIALSYLGTYEYVPGSPEARALDDVLIHTLRIAASYARWRWALKREKLHIKDGEAELPAGFLEMERCSLSQWEIIGTKLVSRSHRCTDAEIVYVSEDWAQQCKLPRHAPIFCDGVALLLASKAAVRITGNYNLSAALENQAREKLYRARLSEVRQQNSNDQQKEVQHG